MSDAPIYALYYTTKFGAGIPAARVRIPVRVTSNHHKALAHGKLLRVSGMSLSLYYRADGTTLGGNFQ